MWRPDRKQTFRLPVIRDKSGRDGPVSHAGLLAARRAAACGKERTSTESGASRCSRRNSRRSAAAPRANSFRVATDGAAGAMERDARDKPARGWQGGRSVSATSRRPNMTRGSQGLGNKACLIRRSSTSGEGGILSSPFSALTDVLRFLTQCPCLSTTCDRWLALDRSGQIWQKSGPISTVSAQFSVGVLERVALSARGFLGAPGPAAVPASAAKGGAT